MPTFSSRSNAILSTCHPELQILFKEVVKEYDCSVLCGFRGEADQDKAFDEGKSKAKYPWSKHNKLPSIAVDVVPYPIDWEDMRRFYHFIGYVMSIANRLGLKVRSGGDWDGDFNFKDQNFHDLPHWELEVL